MPVEFSDKELEFLSAHSVCRFATVDSKGEPHNVPLGYAFDGSRFWMTTEPDSKKHRNLKTNSKVAFVVDEPQKPRKAVMVQGEACVIALGREFEEAIDLIARLRGWRRWKEGEQIVIQVEPRRKISWGLE